MTFIVLFNSDLNSKAMWLFMESLSLNFSNRKLPPKELILLSETGIYKYTTASVCKYESERSKPKYFVKSICL
jgi:hypothetical protein